jgi:hypothetical protein
VVNAPQMAPTGHPEHGIREGGLNALCLSLAKWLGGREDRGENLREKRGYCMSHARERFRHVLSQPTYTVAANLFDPLSARIAHMLDDDVCF